MTFFLFLLQCNEKWNALTHQWKSPVFDFMEWKSFWMHQNDFIYEVCSREEIENASRCV